MKPAHPTLRSAAMAYVLCTVGLLAQAAPDATRGEQVYVRCLACHALTTDRVGPRHCGVVGRRAGAVAGFDYSPAMKKSGLVWDEKTLDRFLKKPLALVPGSSMTYDGVPDAGERSDLVAYLKKTNTDVACRTK
jgi:cytochrome c